jgi:hypothetical protein
VVSRPSIPVSVYMRSHLLFSQLLLCHIRAFVGESHTLIAVLGHEVRTSLVS